MNNENTDLIDLELGFSSSDVEANYDPENDPDLELPPEEEEPVTEDIYDLQRQELSKPKASPINYEAISFKKYERFINFDEKKINEILESLVKENYTEISNENLAEWKEILGDNLYVELQQVKTSVLPEHIDLVNLSLKSKAMLLAQLATFAELMKVITTSNERIMLDFNQQQRSAYKAILQQNTTDFTTSIGKETEAIKGQLGTLYNDLEQKSEDTKNSLHTISAVLNKKVDVLTGLVAQGENINNNLKNAETLATKSFEKVVATSFNNHLDHIKQVVFANTYAKTKEQMKKHQQQQLKFYFIASPIILIIGIAIGKFWH